MTTNTKFKIFHLEKENQICKTFRHLLQSVTVQSIYKMSISVQFTLIMLIHYIVEYLVLYVKIVVFSLQMLRTLLYNSTRNVSDISSHLNPHSLKSVERQHFNYFTDFMTLVRTYESVDKDYFK